MSAPVASFKVFKGAKRERRQIRITAEEREFILRARAVGGVSEVSGLLNLTEQCRELGKLNRQRREREGEDDAS